jgi:hypothetical protein
MLELLGRQLAHWHVPQQQQRQLALWAAIFVTALRGLQLAVCGGVSHMRQPAQEHVLTAAAPAFVV